MNFDWDNLQKNLQKDALTEGNKKTYEVDERFYKLSRDENDNGGALIRFITDADELPFIKMTKINARQTDGSKRFVSDWSPQTIGLPDPFNEKFLKLWNIAGQKEEAKKYSRAFRYLTNIVVVKDPSNADNEGKTFLFDMSPTLFAKIKDAMKPSATELALDPECAKAVYDPIKGNNFLLKVGKAATGFLSYETSKFDEKITGIYKTVAEAEKEITANAYSLNEFLKVESFKTYDELVDKLSWFDGDKNKPAVPQASQADPEVDAAIDNIVEEAKTPATPVEVPAPAPAEKATKPEADITDDELDDLLNSI